MNEPTGLFKLALWASALSLDITAFGPFLLTQPLVCGPLFGYLVGDVQTGLVVGGLVQLLWIDGSPIGVGIPFDSTVVTLLTIGWAHSPDGFLPVSVMTAFLLAIPFGYIFTMMDSGSRKVNQYLIKRLESVPDEWLGTTLTLGTVGGIGLTFVRYVLLYTAALYLGGDAFQYVLTKVNAHPPLVQSATNAIYLLPVAGLGVALEFFLSDESMSWRWPFSWPNWHSGDEK